MTRSACPSRASMPAGRHRTLRCNCWTSPERILRCGICSQQAVHRTHQVNACESVASRVCCAQATVPPPHALPQPTHHSLSGRTPRPLSRVQKHRSLPLVAGTTRRPGRDDAAAWVDPKRSHLSLSPWATAICRCPRSGNKTTIQKQRKQQRPKQKI